MYMPYFIMNDYWQIVELKDNSCFTHKLVRTSGSLVVAKEFRFGAN